MPTTTKTKAAEDEWKPEPESKCNQGQGCVHLVSSGLDGCDLGILLNVAEHSGDYEAARLTDCNQYVEKAAK